MGRANKKKMKIKGFVVGAMHDGVFYFGHRVFKTVSGCRKSINSLNGKRLMKEGRLTKVKPYALMEVDYDEAF